jgi:hypothetical protein
MTSGIGFGTKKVGSYKGGSCSLWLIVKLSLLTKSDASIFFEALKFADLWRSAKVLWYFAVLENELTRSLAVL